MDGGEKCVECGKKIWGIVKVTERVGTEKPTYLHTVCYERLKRNSDLYVNELEKAVEGFN